MKYRILFNLSTYKVQKKVLGLIWITQTRIVDATAYTDTFNNFKDAEDYIKNALYKPGDFLVIKTY